MKVGDLVRKTPELRAQFQGITQELRDSLLGAVLEVKELREYDKARLESNQSIKVCWFNYGTFWTYDDKVELLSV